MHRLVLRLILIAGLVVPTTALLTAAPAGAATQSCNLSHTTTVSPGLEQPTPPDTTDAVQTFKATTTLSGCVGNPGDPTAGSGTATLKSVQPKFPACSDLAQPGNYAAGTAVINWNNGKKSSGTLKVTVDAPQHGTLSGKVTSGLFKGRSFSGAASFNISKGSCSDASPVTGLQGTGTITLT